MGIETPEDVAVVRRWLSEQVRQGNNLARRCLRVLDQAAPEAEIATVRLIVQAIFRVAAQADALLRDRYYAAGAPYGDSEDGLHRWVTEQQTLERERRSRLN